MKTTPCRGEATTGQSVCYISAHLGPDLTERVLAVWWLVVIGFNESEALRDGPSVVVITTRASVHGWC